jgi:hypothetical protein
MVTVKRDRHPALYPQQMLCKRIDRITLTDHNTYLVHYHSIQDEDVTLDCKTVTKIEVDYVSADKIIFSFEQYFTEEVLAKLHDDFLNGKYDDLGGVPQF